MSRPGPAILAALVLGAIPAAAQEEPGARPAPAAAPSLPERLADAPGTWDLSRDGTNRRCVMTLMGEGGEAGRRLAFPAGCRRALPIVAGVAGWLFTDGAVRLVDRNLRPVLLFARRPDQRSLAATAEGGESYSFVPLDTVAMRPSVPGMPGPGATAQPAGEAPVPLQNAPFQDVPFRNGSLQAAPALPAELVRPAPAAAPDGPAPGIYALDRFQERDTCRIALEAPGGARIVPGCRDGGLEVFDPVRWRYANGRITLTAKRGHSLDLVPGGDGRWRRDPEVGTTFVLRRVEP